MKIPDDKLALYVLDAIDNDFEDLEMIVLEVSRWTASDGIAVDRKQIWRALRHLLSSGEARAFQGRLDGQVVALGTIPESDAENVFYISKGKADLRGL